MAEPSTVHYLNNDIGIIYSASFDGHLPPIAPILVKRTDPSGNIGLLEGNYISAAKVCAGNEIGGPCL